MPSIRRLPRFSRTISIQRRSNSSYQAPDQQQSTNNPHRKFYRNFGRPVAQNFLTAVVVYQVLYWSWLKLESMEVQKQKEDEMRSLEGELKSLATKQAIE